MYKVKTCRAALLPALTIEDLPDLYAEYREELGEGPVAKTIAQLVYWNGAPDECEPFASGRRANCACHAYVPNATNPRDAGAWHKVKVLFELDDGKSALVELADGGTFPDRWKSKYLKLDIRLIQLVRLRHEERLHHARNGRARAKASAQKSCIVKSNL